MAKPTYRKDPSDVLDYGFDYSSWMDTGDSISTSTWTVPDGITKTSQSNDDDHTTIWVSGGTAGTKYRITNKIVTDEGRTLERSFDIVVVNR